MELAVAIFMGYLLIGLIFSIAFVVKGVNIVDDAATGGSFWFKLILIPGSTALWPVLLAKWIKSSRR